MRVWRKIESGVITSERLSKVSDSAKWLFVLLLAAQDDEGKYPWTPTMIRALTVTTKWDSVVSESLLSELRVANVADLRDGFVVLRNGAEKNGTPANSKKYVMLYPGIDVLSGPYDDSLTSRERVAGESLTIVQSRVDIREEERRGEGGLGGTAAPLIAPPPASVKKKQEKKALVPWEAPDWFLPLATLPGYRSASNHSSVAEGIAAACAQEGADQAVVVRTFATYYLANRARHGWKDPVAALRKTITIQIEKALNGARPGPAVSPNGPPKPGGAGHVYTELELFLQRRGQENLAIALAYEKEARERKEAETKG